MAGANMHDLIASTRIAAYNRVVLGETWYMHSGVENQLRAVRAATLALARGGWGEFARLQLLAAARCARPVSYTHLTLPTICSV